MGLDRGIQPPDVTLDVRRSVQDRSLELFAAPTKGPLAGRTVPLGPLSAKADLAALAEDIRDDLKKPPSGAIAREAAVRDVGETLWGQMTTEFQDFYSDYLFRHEITSVAICGVNAYLPWELIWPQDPDLPDQVRANMFGASFAIARWPTYPLPQSFQMTSFDIISAPVPPIPVHAKPLPGGFLSEVSNLKANMPNLGFEGTSAADLKRLFAEPKPRILHITAHGDLDQIILQDRPIARQTFDDDKFDRLTQPTLVFLSSCRTAGSQWTPDEFDVESWATAFIALGCSSCCCSALECPWTHREAGLRNLLPEPDSGEDVGGGDARTASEGCNNRE